MLEWRGRGGASIFRKAAAELHLIDSALTDNREKHRIRWSFPSNQEQHVSGINEILVVLIVLLILFYLPKRAAGHRSEKSQGHLVRLSGKMRLAIFGSAVWVAAIAHFFPPWQEKVSNFIYFGIGPLAVAWGIGWVVTGYRNRS